MSVLSSSSAAPVQDNALALVQQQGLVEQQNKEEGVQASLPSVFTEKEIPVEVIAMIFQRLHPRDVAQFMMANREFKGIAQHFIALQFGSASGKAFISNYGFNAINDPRTLRVIQKAFDACYFEGQGEGLSFGTLGAKLQIAEDRNLVKLFLRYLNDSVPGSAAPNPKEWPAESEFLKENPQLNTCCISNVADIPGAASAIRTWMQNGNTIQTWRLPLSQLSGGDANHLHDKHMCIITPEVGYFRTDRIDGSSNAIMLVSKNIAAALTLDRNHSYHGVGIDLSNNNLGVLPDEIAAIPHLRELNVQENDAGMELPHAADAQHGT